jgi:glycerol-3-phosphate acyltransferase PlsY
MAMDVPWVWAVAGIVAAFFMGSVPYGLLAGKLKGIDIRKVGSGNIGTTNVFRCLGARLGTAVFLLDFAKGFLPVWLFKVAAGIGEWGWGWEAGWILVGLAAVCGHNFSPFVNFKGGKGIATSAGVLAGLMPLSFLICFALWAVLFLGTGYMSVASIAAALALPVSAWLLYGDSPWLCGLALLMGILAVVRHRSNIGRLKAGTENRFSFGRKKKETTS